MLLVRVEADRLLDESFDGKYSLDSGKIKVPLKPRKHTNRCSLKAVEAKMYDREANGPVEVKWQGLERFPAGFYGSPKCRGSRLRGRGCRWIHDVLPKRKQVLALSATYTPALLSQLEELMREPRRVLLCPDTVSLLGVRQFYSLAPGEPLLSSYNPQIREVQPLELCYEAAPGNNGLQASGLLSLFVQLSGRSKIESLSGTCHLAEGMQYARVRSSFWWKHSGCAYWPVEHFGLCSTLIHANQDAQVTKNAYLKSKTHIYTIPACCRCLRRPSRCGGRRAGGGASHGG